MKTIKKTIEYRERERERKRKVTNVSRDCCLCFPVDAISLWRMLDVRPRNENEREKKERKEKKKEN